MGVVCVFVCVLGQDAREKEKKKKDADMFCLIVKFLLTLSFSFSLFFYCVCESLFKCSVSSNIYDYCGYVNWHRIFLGVKSIHLLHVFVIAVLSHSF